MREACRYDRQLVANFRSMLNLPGSLGSRGFLMGESRLVKVQISGRGE